MTNKRNFPRRKSRRDYLLSTSADPHLRMIYRVRHYTGWLLVFVSALFLVLNLQLFTPTSLRNRLWQKS